MIEFDMVNVKNLCLVALAATAIGSCRTDKTGADTGEEIFFADPTIFVENGKYYLTGTRGAGAIGFQLLESDDLTTWTMCHADTARFMLKQGEQTFGDWGFWAPQIYKEEGSPYCLFYTANEQVVVAKSDSLTGKFTQKELRPIDGSEKNIDPFLFKDDDGKYYLYHVRFDNGNYLWSAEYDIENDSIDKSTLVRCFGLTDAWEKTDDNKWSPVMEGPTVFKKDGVYYMFYSANHFLNQDYAVGYATAPAPQGPWTKYAGNPIIHKSIVGEPGSGHGDMFKGLDDKLYYVYHVHNCDSVATPRRTRIVPLIFQRNDSTDVYTISADSANIIIPRIK